MDLEKMILAQRELEAVIEQNHPTPEGGEKHRFEQDYTNLFSEIGEMLSKWRRHKYWSHDNSPLAERECQECGGSGGLFEFGDCHECKGRGNTNKLLEEVADVITGYLTIAVKKDWTDELYMQEDAFLEAEEEGLSGDIEGVVLESLHFISAAACIVNNEKAPFYKASSMLNKQHDEWCFGMSWYVMYLVLRIGMGFTDEQLEEAYLEKHAINLDRQVVGY